MANFLQILQKARFLLVGALVFAFLSTPFITEAGTKSTSTAQIVSVTDTIAGLSTELEVKGKANQSLEIAIKKPDNSELVLKVVTDGQGSADLTVSDYHLRQAGDYQVAAREANSNIAYGTSKSFKVYPGTVSESKSTVDLSKQAAGLGETVELTVSLSDSYSNAIQGHVLKVMSSSSSAAIYSQDFATDENGQMEFYLSSNKKGVYDFSVFDSSMNKTLNAKATVAFSSTGTIADIGGHQSVQLAADAGPVDSFVISGVDDPVTVGDGQSIVVKAIDADGFTVVDYTGNIRFSSSDSSATLPNDYTFMADDQGEHTFSLAVKFVTPGTQTLTVTDTDEFSITGSVSTEVVTDDESSVDYDSDFESTDFERDGDFTLISPASGSYSSDSIEVQGEAEYGYTAVVYMNGDEMAREEVDFDNTFTVSVDDLADGTYELYVDIVELGDGEPGEEEIVEVLEESASETIVIDTTAPEIVSITADPEDGLTAGQTVVLTVLSEADLEEASIIFEDEIYPLEETSTSGKYQTEIPMPEATGDYTVDVLLMDSLGNEVEYRDQLTLSLTEASEEEEEEEPVEEETETVGVGVVSGLSTTSAAETVLLSWEPAESENEIAYYRVYYGPSASSLFAVSETYDSSTSWSILDLNGGSSYYFAVAAVDVEGTEG